VAASEVTPAADRSGEARRLHIVDWPPCAHSRKAGRASLFLCALFASSFSNDASAHAFGLTYTLPLPFHLYVYACLSALIASFGMVAIFVRHSGISYEAKAQECAGSARALLVPVCGRRSISASTLLSAATLWLGIVAGLIGTQNATANINMTLFWVIFVLGFQFGVALFGNFYPRVNPWRASVEIIERVRPQIFPLQDRRPPRYGYAIALFFLLAVGWIELLGGTTPRSLALILLAYSVINVLGCRLIGVNAWFEQCELFSVLFGVIAHGRQLVLAPHRLRSEVDHSLEKPPWTLVFFIVFMLSCTAVDGLRDTRGFVELYWDTFYHAMAPLIGGDVIGTFGFFEKLYHVYLTVTLILSPVPIVFALWLTGKAARRLTRSDVSALEFARWFSPSIIPVAVAYSFAHYFTLLPSQGLQIVALLSDPFGFGWNVFGTATRRFQLLIDAGVIWHVQVVAIVAGHVAGIYVAHVIAMRRSGNTRDSMVSQLPMLVLMMGLTTAGLWILSQPLVGAIGSVR
jgi:hypothetical protein